MYVKNKQPGSLAPGEQNIAGGYLLIMPMKMILTMGNSYGALSVCKILGSTSYSDPGKLRTRNQHFSQAPQVILIFIYIFKNTDLKEYLYFGPHVAEKNPNLCHFEITWKSSRDSDLECSMTQSSMTSHSIYKLLNVH